MANGNTDFSGNWSCKYWYPSNLKPGTEEVSQYIGVFHRINKKLVYESKPSEDGSYMFVRMSVDDDLVTGTWHETTSPTGEFAGSMYSGAFQALIDEPGSRVDGKWTGIGQEGGKRQIYTGRILFERK